MNILFDMETGDPDDLITLLLLLNNPQVNLKAITCYQGSPIQIGLISHVLELANQTGIPVGGWNPIEPVELSSYYADTVGHWTPQFAALTPQQVFKQSLQQYPDITILTGAPLTNIAASLMNVPDIKFKKVVTQGGYLGDLIPEKLSKFKGKNAYRTYNLGCDLSAFTVVNTSNKIEQLTYVTKDLCHGFIYTKEIHQGIKFGQAPIPQLLKTCLSKYARSGKSKAMHDPLAMLIALYPNLGTTLPITMSYHIDEREHSVFSSTEGNSFTQGLISYNKEKAWAKFCELCEQNNYQRSR